MARVFRHLFQHLRRQERRMGRQYPSLSEHHLISDWFLIGISILDLLLDLPPTSRHGHFGVHPIRFRSQRPDPISRPSCDRLCFPHELHRAQRMAFRRVRRTNAEYCCCAWCPEFVRVFFHPSRDVCEFKTYPENSVRQRKGSLLGLLTFLMVAGALALNMTATILLTRASIANYPGGHALARLNERYGESPHGK